MTSGCFPPGQFPRLRRHLSPLLLILLTVSLARPATGQTVWNGSVNNTLNTAGNWSSGLPSNTVAAMLNLAHAGTLTLNASSTLTLGDFTIGDITAGTPGAFELTGSAITFSKVGGNSLLKQGTATDIIRNALTLSTALNVNVADVAGTLELNGAIGAGTLNKTGNGKLVISGGANNALSVLNAQQGTTVLAKDSNSNTTIRAVTGALTIGGATATDTATVQIGGTYTGLGDTHLGAGYRDQIASGTVVTVNAFGTLDLNGNSEGIGQLVGAGKVTNSVVSTTSILAVGDGVPTATAFAFSGTIENGAGTVSLLKVASSTLTLNGANTFTGEAIAGSGTLALGGAQGSLATQTIRIARGTFLLDNTTANNNDRISDTATVTLEQGSLSGGLVLRRNNTEGVNSSEKIGTLSVENGHNVVRFDHSEAGNGVNIRANVLTLEMDHYDRGIGGTVAFAEAATAAAPTGYNYFSSTNAAGSTTLSKIILNNLPDEWLVGGNGSSGYNRKVLIGAFGNPDPNTIANRFGTTLMTVETVAGVNYVRPLDATEFREIGAGATTAVISSSNLTGGTPAVLADDNVKITGPTGAAGSPLTIRIGVTDNQLAGHIAFNSWWQESPVSPTVVASTNIRIAGNNVVHLGDWAGDTLHDEVTGGSGTMFFNGGRATTATPAGGGYGTAVIRGGTIDFGNREAIIYLDVTNTVQFYTTLTGTGGVTKTGGGQAHFYGWNTYSGVTTHALNELWVYTDTALGQSGAGNEVINYSTFLLNSGINIGSLTDETQRKDLLWRGNAFYAAGGKLNSWNGDVLLENVSEAGEYNSLTLYNRETGTMVINGNMTGVGAANPILI